MSNTKKNKFMSNTKVITGEVRFSYANVFEAKAIVEGQTPKFSISLVIPKTDTKTVDKIKAAIQAALLEGKDKKFGGKIPKSYKNPLRDGDKEREDDEVYANSYFINANSVQRPGVVDENTNDIIDNQDFYSGCFGRASVNFYAFNTNGNKGVACGLNNLQKLREGDKLGGSSASAEDDFADDDMS